MSGESAGKLINEAIDPDGVRSREHLRRSVFNFLDHEAVSLRFDEVGTQDRCRENEAEDQGPGAGGCAECEGGCLQ